MKTFIAYDKDTFKILGFIRNDYSKLEDVDEVFQNFENYEIVETDVEMPENFYNLKVIIRENKMLGFENVEMEV